MFHHISPLKSRNRSKNWFVVWLPSILNFPINIGLHSSSQLTHSYFSEGWPNHQPELNFSVEVRLFWLQPYGKPVHRSLIFFLGSWRHHNYDELHPLAGTALASRILLPCWFPADSPPDSIELTRLHAKKLPGSILPLPFGSRVRQCPETQLRASL